MECSTCKLHISVEQNNADQFNTIKYILELHATFYILSYISYANNSVLKIRKQS